MMIYFSYRNLLNNLPTQFIDNDAFKGDFAMDGQTNHISSRMVAEMSFKMAREWHRRFKLRALKEGISMTALFKKCFAFYILHNPL